MLHQCSPCSSIMSVTMVVNVLIARLILQKCVERDLLHIASLIVDRASVFYSYCSVGSVFGYALLF